MSRNRLGGAFDDADDEAPDDGDEAAFEDTLGIDDESDDASDEAPEWLGHFREDVLPEVGSYVASDRGVVYLVGAGPGDPGLLTVRGRELLDRCDAIVHDALAHPSLLERTRAGRAAPELHDVGKRGGDDRSARQEDINELLIALARDGKRVVRLKGGDPLVFGRGSEEAQALAEAGVAFEIVPGVTSGIAAPAYAGIPVTHRGMSTSVTFVTGHEAPDKTGATTNWAALAQAGGTLVLYMAVKQLPTIVAALVEAGLPAEIPAAAIEWGTHARQRTVTATLGTLADAMRAAGLGAPVITVIGWTTVLRDEIAWFDRRPLFGVRVAVTRPAEGSRLSAPLRELGASVLEIPATRLAPLDPEPLHDALQWLDQYEWVVFTSGNAVRLFWDALRAGGRDARAFGAAKVAVVGPATAAALLARGIAVDVQAERFVAEGVLAALEGRDDVVGARVLYVTARGARETLRDGLEEMGAMVEVVEAYESVPDADGARRLRAAVEAGEVDVVTLTSASSARAFAEAAGADLASRVPVASIGPQTSAAAREAGLDVRVEAEAATLDALVAAVVDAAAGLREPGR